MSKTKATLIGVLLLLVAVPMFGTTYFIPPEDPADAKVLSGTWHFNSLRNEWYNKVKWDTLADTPSIATPRVDTNGPIIMESNWWFVYILGDGDSSGVYQDSFATRTYLDVSMDGINWVLYDSTTCLGLPTTPLWFSDTLFGIYDAWARTRTTTQRALANRDTLFYWMKIIEPNGPVW